MTADWRQNLLELPRQITDVPTIIQRQGSQATLSCPDVLIMEIGCNSTTTIFLEQYHIQLRTDE